MSLFAGALALLLGAAALAALVAFRRREGPWTVERWALRGALIGLCVLAGLGPMAPDAAGARTRVLVLDRSRSLRAGASEVERAAAGALADLEAHERVGLVVFGATARVAFQPLPLGEARGRLAAALAEGGPPDWGSDLAGALRAAAGLLPEHGGEVVLVTDGRADAPEAALEASAEVVARGAPIHCLAPDVAPPRGARLAAIEAPPAAAPGERVAIRASVAAARPVRFTLRLERRQARRWVELASQQGEATPGREHVGRFEVAAAAGRREGALVLRARVEALGRDDGPEDDALEARVAVGTAPRALVVGRPLPALEGRDLHVEALRPSELADALRRSPPDLVVLSDAPASALVEAVPALGAALRAGVGLAVCGVGGFGPGGYAGSALEELLPVTSGPARERQRPLALLVALDASGSMASGRYLRAVQAGVPWDALREGDALAVLLFAGAPRTFQPFGPAPKDLIERLVRVEPAGPTDVGAALLAGLEQLRTAQTGPAEGGAERVLVLATDSEDKAPERHAAGVTAAARALAGARARALLLHIGDGPLRSLEALAAAARAGGLETSVARAQEADRDLRALIEGELGAGRSEVRQGDFALAAGEPARALGLEPPARVTAYVAVRAREEPEVRVLGAIADPELEQPPWGVLGRRGLGRVLCLPLPAEGCVPLLRAATRTLVPARARALRLRAAREGGGLRVEGEHAAGGALPLDLSLEVAAEDDAQTLPLVPASPRRAHAWLTAPPTSALQVALVRGGERVALQSVAAAAHGELEHPEPDHALLARLAEGSGGEVLAGPGAAPRRAAPPDRRPLAPWLAGAALLALVLELGALTLRALRAPRAGEP
ncbi:MAG: VWA domain-containing protein [Planctomycetota bacterium]